jgi:hypothetical protein
MCVPTVERQSGQLIKELLWECCSQPKHMGLNFSASQLRVKMQNSTENHTPKLTTLFTVIDSLRFVGYAFVDDTNLFSSLD